MAADVAMDDMQIDFTMEEEDPEIARLRAEADAINAQAENGPDSAMNVEQPPEEGELDSSAPALNKVHIRGLDHLNTYDIEAWVSEHGQADLFRKVQWVDDTSANLIFDNELAAAEALNVLSAEEASDPLQIRPAKQMAAHPDSALSLRQAILADVKAPRAKDRSAFYLFNKEWDPDNPDNIRPDRKRRQNPASGRPNKLRRREPESQPFNEDLYDDNPQALARRNSLSSNGDNGQRPRARFGEDLMGDRRGGRLRDRSASPAGDGDGRYGFRDDQPSRRTARARSPPVRAGRDNRAARDSLRKELFPDRKAASSSALGNGGADVRPGTPPKELFPGKSVTPSHRRQAAQDLHPDEVATAIGQYHIDGAADARTHRTYSGTGRRQTERSERDGGAGAGAGRDLFSRIEGGPKLNSRHGRLADEPSSSEGFNIRGAGAAPGFSILGASRERTENPLVKELFPVRAGVAAGGGKDLFDGRIKGRGAQRRRAEDMF